MYLAMYMVHISISLNYFFKKVTELFSLSFFEQIIQEFFKIKIWRIQRWMYNAT